MSKSWTPEEESLLNKLKAENDCDWKKISELMSQQFPDKIRTPKQCRERFVNYARFELSEVRSQEWIRADSQYLLQCILKMGFQWQKISSFFLNRSGNVLKNKFNNCINKLMRKINLVLNKEKQLPITYNSIKRLFDLSELIPSASTQDKFEAEKIKSQILEKALLQCDQQLNTEWLVNYRYRLNTLNKRYKSIHFKKRAGKPSVSLQNDETSKRQLSPPKIISDQKKDIIHDEQEFKIPEVQSLILIDQQVIQKYEETLKLKQPPKQHNQEHQDPFGVGDCFDYFGY